MQTHLAVVFLMGAVVESGGCFVVGPAVSRASGLHSLVEIVQGAVVALRARVRGLGGTLFIGTLVAEVAALALVLVGSAAAVNSFARFWVTRPGGTVGR